MSAFALSGSTCNRIVIQDHEICGDKGELGARCNRLLTEHPRNPDFDQWAVERFGQFCMKADAWTEIISALLKLCDQTKRCTWQEIEDLQRLGKRVTVFQKEIDR